MTTVLLTGFEPFGGETINPSWEAVQQVRDAWSGPADLHLLRLPVDFATVDRLLTGAIASFSPDVVICVGQAGGRAEISVERVAINVDDARIPDNLGFQPIDEPIEPAGPAAYFSTLPIKASVAAATTAGVPAHVSQTAGTYTCNHVFYRLMHELATRGNVARGGFVHVPYSPEQAAGTPHPSMAVTTIAQGLDAILAATLATTTDARLPGGALS